MRGGSEPAGAGAVLVTDDGYRLPLGECGAGGERLIEPVRAQRLAGLGYQLGLAQARALLEEAPDLSVAARSTASVTLNLAAYARLAFAEDDPERAARLEGAAEGLRRRAGLRVWPTLRQWPLKRQPGRGPCPQPMISAGTRRSSWA